MTRQPRHGDAILAMRENASSLTSEDSPPGEHNLRIANPLPAALAHYTRELEDTLERTGAAWETAHVRGVEGRQGMLGRLGMLGDAVLNVLQERGGPESSLVVWPSLGLLEARLWTSRRAKNAVFLHDPIPLRRQAGFGRLSRWIVRRNNPLTAPLVVSHSKDALAQAESLLPRNKHAMVLHPILTSQRSIPKTAVPTVVVAGQYKPQRDLPLLAELGPRLNARGIRCQILGRGWPEVPGWEVDSRFVSEDELDSALGSAWAVILPYRMYFQSGIAIRALELGTVTVSPPTSFAVDLTGGESVVEDPAELDSWEGAIDWCVQNPGAAKRHFDEYRDRVDASWTLLLSDGLATPARTVASGAINQSN